MKIIVESQEEKNAILEESKCVHDMDNGTDCPILAHIYAHPKWIEIKKSKKKVYHNRINYPKDKKLVNGRRLGGK